MKRNKLITTSLCALVLLAGSIALADDRVTATSTEFKNKTELQKALFKKVVEKATSTKNASTTATSTIHNKMEGKKAEKRDEKCEKVTSNIDKHISDIEKWSLENVTHFQQISLNIKNALPALQVKGIDITKVTADLVIFDVKIAKLRADKVILEEKLRSTKEYKCDHSEGEFKTALKDARDQKKQVNADRQDILKFINDTLRPDVKVLRGEKIELKIEAKASSTHEVEIKLNPRQGKSDRNTATKSPETIQ